MADARPNLLLLMSDDQGPWALGCAGTPELRTPVLDQLAAEGTRFTNFFCASPVCSPARASWLTGRIPSQHGIHDWLRSGNIDVAEGVTWSGADRPLEYLAGQTGFTAMLAAAGYHCALSGKWHLGDSARPQQGHTWWYAHALGGASYVDWHGFDNTPELSHKTQYVTDWITDRALDFLADADAASEPWCLSVHYTAPHAPWGREQHPAELFDSYADCDFASIPPEPPHCWGGWSPSPEQRQLTLQGYAAAITAMDTQIGRLLADLDARGLRERTLVVFTSDNGFSVGQHGICGKGNGTWPLNFYEESVKVPFIASLPGRVPAQRVHDGLCSHYDWFPTLADWLGLELPAGEALPGRSFANVLRGEQESGAEALVVFDEYGPGRMIRTRDWKYVARPGGPNELYDLANDPGERRNLADDPGQAARVAELAAALGEWYRRWADPARDGAAEPVSGLGQVGWAGWAESYVQR